VSGGRRLVVRLAAAGAATFGLAFAVGAITEPDSESAAPEVRAVEPPSARGAPATLSISGSLPGLKADPVASDGSDADVEPVTPDNGGGTAPVTPSPTTPAPAPAPEPVPLPTAPAPEPAPEPAPGPAPAPDPGGGGEL